MYWLLTELKPIVTAVIRSREMQDKKSDKTNIQSTLTTKTHTQKKMGKLCANPPIKDNQLGHFINQHFLELDQSAPFLITLLLLETIHTNTRI